LKELKKSKQTKLLVLFLIIVSGVGLFSLVSAQEESQIPAWIKTAVGFWVNDQISDEEFLNAIEYFVENEMIKVPSQTNDDQILIKKRTKSIVCFDFFNSFKIVYLVIKL